MSKKMFVGASREIITPPVGTLLSGYFPRWHSKSVNDDLNVTAVSFKQGETSCILLSITVCEMYQEVSDRIRKAISREVSVDFDNIVLNCIHNHTSPACYLSCGWMGVDEDYCYNILLPKCVKASKDAVCNAKEAKMAIGTTNSNVGVNRRVLSPEGEVDFGQNPHGSYDPKMTVLSFKETETGKGIVNLIHYGCHGTSIGRSSAISRDWSGFMCDAIQDLSNTLTTFIIGACGDVGPRISNGRTEGSVELCRELGNIAIDDAKRAYLSLSEYETDFELKFQNIPMKLECKPMPTESETDEKLRQMEEDSGGTPELAFEEHGSKYAYYVKVKKAYTDGIANRGYNTYETQFISFGDVAIISFPFEMFSETLLRISDCSPFRYTLSLSNCNGQNGYFPSFDQIQRGGYEVKSFLHGNAFSLLDDSDNRVVCHCRDVLNELKK